jgi:predicted esterase YcpF (UPF0227 family)
MKLLYVHGYNGDPYGSSYQNLKNACGDDHELYTFDYNPEFPKHAIKELFQFVKENKIDCVIGASLGGFLTMNLYGVSRIVVNPCWDPANELYKLGYRGDNSVYEELLDGMTETLDFEERNLCSGVFSTDDELLGDKYVSTFEKYFKNTSFIKGGHKISEAMANYIIKVILHLHEKEAKDFVKKLKDTDNAPWL